LYFSNAADYLFEELPREAEVEADGRRGRIAQNDPVNAYVAMMDSGFKPIRQDEFPCEKTPNKQDR
jgi:hypothetical protein